jgi:sulfonate transport system permease protein
VIFLIGICFDYLLGTVRHWFFPYARLVSGE